MSTAVATRSAKGRTKVTCEDCFFSRHGLCALELAEKGFGTSVSITAEHARPDSDEAEAALEQLLDELGSPERRPFARR